MNIQQDALPTKNGHLTPLLIALLVLCIIPSLTFSQSQSTKSFSAFSEKGKYNVFSITKEPFLLLNAPVFQVLPLKKVSLPQSIVDDIFKKAEKVSGTQLPVTSIPTSPRVVTENLPIENSLVNIFCSQKVEGSSTLRKTITGSGVLIHKDGTVLTNAHVAQFPLIADSSSKVVCLARTGSPAQSTHSVKVAFISPEWIKYHAQYINTSVPESGQNDYALLVISPIGSKDTTSSNTGTSNTSLTLSPTIVQKDLNALMTNKAVVAGYPAEILGKNGVNSALFVQKDSVTVQKTYTFSGNSLTGSTFSSGEVLETSPTIVAQIGSSGGALADIHNHLVGLITTVVPSGVNTSANTESATSASSGTNASGAKNNIRAISIDYINNDISSYHSSDLTYINSNGSSRLKSFFDSAYRDNLTSLLLQNLK